MKYSVLETIKLKTSKGSLELIPGQFATLPDRIASKLLDEGRIVPCNVVLEPISDEVLQGLFLETMNEINDEYLIGTIKYIEEYHKSLDNEINTADGRINEVWQKCNDGEASIENFKSALVSYKTLYLKGIKLFKDKTV